MSTRPEDPPTTAWPLVEFFWGPLDGFRVHMDPKLVGRELVDARTCAAYRWDHHNGARWTLQYRGDGAEPGEGALECDLWDCMLHQRPTVKGGV